MISNTVKSLIAASVLVLSATTFAAESKEDPLKSVMWDFLVKNELQIDPEKITFDDRVKVYAPDSVEDGMNVPVSVRVTGIDDIEEIVVLADHNPIQRALNFFPGEADPFIAFRMKVQEATPIRAVVRTAAGNWHVGSVWLDAPGGGCTTPSVSQADRLWEDSLNLIGAQVWQKPDGGNRLRLRIIHPMDTGLVSRIPAFFLETMFLKTMDGAKTLAHLETFEPISENPVFTFSVPPESTNGQGYQLVGRDNNGNDFLAKVNTSGSKLDLESMVANHE